MKSMARFAPSLLLAALPTLGSVACHPASPPRVGVRAPLPAPAEALAPLQQLAKTRRDLRAEGRLTYFGEAGRVRLKAVIVAERPGRFRFETISPLEQPIDVMTCDGSELALLSKEKLRVGPATPENIARLVPLPLAPEEVVDVLLGGVPTSERFHPVGIAWADDQERWVLSVVGIDGERGRLTIDPERRVVVEMVLLDDADAPRLTVRFDDYQDVRGAPLPHAIQVRARRPELEVEIRLKEVDVNVELARALFRIEPPPGIRPEPLAAEASIVPSPAR